MEGIEKPTRNALRAMRVGTTRVFRLPENKFVNTARVMANQLKHEEGLVFQVNADYEAKCQGRQFRDNLRHQCVRTIGRSEHIEKRSKGVH